MATQVSLVVTLDNKGVLTGVRQINDGFDDLDKKVKKPGKSGEDTFNGIESAERRAHLAGMLFARTTGVEIPRALETIIARSQVMGPLLASAFNVAVIGASIGAVVTLGEKIIEITDAMGGYTEQVKEMHKETIKASEEALLHPASLEIGQQQLQNLRGQKTVQDDLAKSLDARIMKAENEANIWEHLLGIADARALKEIFINSAKEKGNVLDEQQRKLQEEVTKLEQERSQLMVADLGAKYSEAGLQGFALLKQKHLDEIARLELEKNQRTSKGEFAQGEPADFAAKRVTAEREYSAQVLDLRRSVATETRALNNKVMEDSLEGVAKIQYAETQELAELRRKASLGLVDNFDEQKSAIVAHALGEISKAYKDLQKQIDETAFAERERSTENLIGSTKIIAQADIERDKIKAAQNELMNTFIMDYKERALRDKLLQDKLVALDKDTTDKLTQHHQELTDKLKDMQQQAAIAGLPEWQRAGAQILLDRQKTFEELSRLEAKDSKNTDIYEQQRVAADQLANARLRDEHKKLVEELGSDLESVYDDAASGNLGKRILANIKKLFFQIMAEWLLTTKMMGSVFGQLFGNLVIGPGTQGGNIMGGQGGLGSLFGSLFGSAGIPGVGGSPGVTPPFVGNSMTSAGGAAGGGAAGSSSSGTGGLTLAQLLGGPGGATNALTGSPGGPSGGDAALPFASGLTLNQANSLAGGSGTSKLAGPASLVNMLLGSAGGTTGQIGGMLASLAMMNPQFLQNLSSAIPGLGDGVGQNLGSLAGILGIASAGLTGFGLGEGHGKLLGTLGGAASGALTGFIVGGPIGALIGGIVGALGGLFGGIFGGSKRKKQANALFDSQIGPSITKIEAEYKGFQLDYSSTISQLEDLRTQSQTSLGQLKSEGKSVFSKKVSPAIDAAEKEINDLEAERQRRAGLVFGPPEFHEGGYVSAGMSSFLRRPGELLAVLKHGEYVMNPTATKKNIRALEHMNSGGSPFTMGDLHIHPTVLDKAYLQSPTGFRKDVRAALVAMQNEGQI